MKKVLSFCLWGNNPTYTIGAIKNAELAKIFYPDFECWFYIHQETVPLEIIDELKLLNNVKIIFKTGQLENESCTPMMWRFEAIDSPEVEIMISRDTDSRIYLREKLAVDEWLSSDTIFHIMRDHPCHNFSILGGMFGTKKIKEIPNWTELINKITKNSNRDYDQDFLRDYIYPVIKNNSTIHATFFKKESHAKDFPIKYCNDFKFVGEYVYADESRNILHINLLKNAIN